MISRTLTTTFVTALCAGSAHAVIFSGAGGQGVPVGSSSLISTVDYGDTFRGFADGGSNSARVYVAAVQPAAAYPVESVFGNPAVNFRSQSQGAGIAEFSFAADGPGTPGLVGGSPAYPGTSGAGSATGFTQTGGSVDYGIPYGLRTRYTVQFDAVMSGDRMDITSGPTAGTIFGGANSLSIFIRGDGTGGVSLFNGTDTPTTLNTGLANDGRWHNFAATFDTIAKTVSIYVDESFKGTVDLVSFAGGAYQNFSNANVGVGLGLPGTQNRSWTDNFQVGAAIPEPTAALLLGGFAGLGLLRRRRVS